MRPRFSFGYFRVSFASLHADAFMRLRARLPLFVEVKWIIHRMLACTGSFSFQASPPLSQNIFTSFSANAIIDLQST